MGTEKEKRLLYIDALRGITMILVVYHHIVTPCINGTLINVCLHCIRMPMFFFVSGFIAYKGLDYWTASNTKSRVIKKFKVQIIPSIIFYALYFFFVKHYNPFTHWIEHGWEQYWFTTSLFEFFIIYYTTNFLTRNSIKANYLVLFVLIVLSLVSLDIFDKSSKWCIWLNFYSITSYLYVFLLGTLVRRHFDIVKKWLDKWWILALDAIIFFLQFTLYYLCYKGILHLPVKFINIMSAVTMRISGLALFFGLFVFFRHKFTEDNLTTRVLTFVGRRTLDIYLLHFFFIIHIKDIHNNLLTAGLGQFEYPFFIALTCLVTACCLLVSGVIKKWKFAGKLLFAAKY